MLNRIVFCWLLVALANTVCGQEKKSPDADAIKQKMIEEVQKEIRSLFKNEFDLAIRDYQKHFELDKQTIENLDKLAAEFAEKQLKGCQENRIENVLTRKVKSFKDVESFTVNGRLVRIVANTEKIPINITVSRVRQWIWISGPSGGSSLNSTVEINLRKSKPWRKALSGISNEDIKKYYNEIDRRQRQSTIDLMLVFLTDELLLTENQREPVKKWLETTYKKPTQNTSIYNNARNHLRNFQAKPPKILSEIQVEALKRMQLRLKNE